MADVTGDLGGQPIQLNNAATESTLKELVLYVAALQKQQSTKSKKDSKVQKDLEAELKRLAKTVTDANKQQKKTIDGLKEEADSRKKLANARDQELKSLKNSIESLEKQKKGIENLSAAIENYSSKISSVTNNLASLGNSVTAAASALGQIPVFGGMLSSTFGTVAAAAEKSYKAFQQSASVGANFSGSISQMINAASGAGLTFDEFSNIISKNGESLALLGKGTSDGARRLAELGKQVRKSGIADELYRMGYSAADISNGMATFGARLAKGGALQNMTTEQLADVTGRYLKDLDAVAKLTGQSKEALQQQEQARMRDAQYLNLKNKLDAEGQKNLEILMSTIPEGMQEGAKEVLATGTATTEAGQQFLAYMQRSGRGLNDLRSSMLKTGTMTSNQMVNMSQSIQKEGAALAKSPLGDTLSSFVKETNGLMVAANQMGARTTDIAKEKLRQDEERLQQEKKLLEKGLDPASMQKFQQRLAELSNEVTKIVAEHAPKLIQVFESIVKVVTGPLMSAFSLMVDNIGKIVLAFGALKIAQIVYQKKLEAAQFKMAQRGSSSTDPMWVRDVSGPGGDLGSGGSGGGKKGKGGIKPGLKGLGIGMVGGIALDYASGKAEEAGHSKTAAGLDIGSSALAAAGTGAMIGSVIPGLGTAVGTAIGAVVGGGMGLWNNWNKLTGKNVKLKEEENKALAQSVDAKEKDIEATKNAAEGRCALPDWMDPASTLKWHAQTSQQPGTSTSGGMVTPGESGTYSMPDQAPADIQKYLQATALVESGGNASARAGTSSAGGMFQFIDSTWKQMTKEMGKDYSLQDKFDPKKASEVMAYFTQKQKGQLEKGIGRQASNTDLYMAHFLGAGGATKFLNAMQKNPGQSAAAMDPAAAKANKNIYYDKSGRERSLQEVYSLMGSKISKAESAVASGKWGGKEISKEVLALGGKNPSATVASAKPVSERDKAYHQENAKLDDQEKKLKEAKARAYAARGVDPNKAIDADLTAGRSIPGMVQGMPVGRPGSPSWNFANRLSQGNESDLIKGSARTPRTALPSVDQVASMGTKMVDEVSTKGKKMVDETANGASIGKVQETAESLLASLNNKFDQMLQQNARLGEVNERQLSVQRGLVSDVFQSV
jgi:hypothetical protein